jgi:hypothetical protein
VQNFFRNIKINFPTCLSAILLCCWLREANKALHQRSSLVSVRNPNTSHWRASKTHRIRQENSWTRKRVSVVSFWFSSTPPLQKVSKSFCCVHCTAKESCGDKEKSC